MFLLPFILYYAILRQMDCYTFIDKNTSFLQYKQWNMDETGTLEFRFKTLNDYGLIMYSDTSQTASYAKSYIALKLIRGELEATIQMGADDYRSVQFIKLGADLNDMQWHQVSIERDAVHPKVTYIQLDNERKSLVNDGEHSTMKLNSGLFFGGMPQQLDNMVDGSWMLEPRLVGCIEQVQFLRGQNKTSTEAELVTKEAVSPGCLDACQGNVCPNGGRCSNYFTRYKCDCVGTGFTGPNCQQVADVLHFDGETRLEIEVPTLLRATKNNEISLRFKTREANGLLLSTLSNDDHLMVEIYNSIIRMSINLGGGYHVFRITTQPFSDGQWHLIEIKRQGRDVYLVVDKKYSLSRSLEGQFSTFNLREKLYIGGHPNHTAIRATKSLSNASFTGCIQQVYFNNLNIFYRVLHTRTSSFMLVGKKTTSCSVTKAKVIVVRNSEDTKVSESAKPYDGASPTNNPVQGAKKKVDGDDHKTLSKNSITWIVVGLVCGTLVLILSIIIIVHNVRHRYSGVFLSSHVKEQYHKQLTPDRAGTLLYQPKNFGKRVIEPHIV